MGNVFLTTGSVMEKMTVEITQMKIVVIKQPAHPVSLLALITIVCLGCTFVMETMIAGIDQMKIQSYALLRHAATTNSPAVTEIVFQAVGDVMEIQIVLTVLMRKVVL